MSDVHSRYGNYGCTLLTFSLFHMEKSHVKDIYFSPSSVDTQDLKDQDISAKSLKKENWNIPLSISVSCCSCVSELFRGFFWSHGSRFCCKALFRQVCAFKIRCSPFNSTQMDSEKDLWTKEVAVTYRGVTAAPEYLSSCGISVFLINLWSCFQFWGRRLMKGRKALFILTCCSTIRNREKLKRVWKLSVTTLRTEHPLSFEYHLVHVVNTTLHVPPGDRLHHQPPQSCLF